MNRFLALCAPLLAIAIAGCDRVPAAFGEANSVILAVPDSVWAQVSDTVLASLEPTIFTVRDERAFEVTQTSPVAPQWQDLRKFKRIVVVGRASDPWVEPVLDGRATDNTDRATLFDSEGIWAGGQSITAVVLPDAAEPAAAITSILPQLHERIDIGFRRYARRRMFASGRDSALADTLRRQAGFTMLLPRVYAWSSLDSTTYRFLNTYPDPSRLIRSIVVTWRPGAADALDADAVLAWRDTLADARYEYFSQVTTHDRIETRTPAAAPSRSLEVAGVWSTPPGDWPAAGPFITRAIPCPAQDRTYLLDAWLYAPGTDKYEYVIQLQTILDSFECG